MNKRIEELAEQAGMHKWGIADDAKYYATERHNEGVDLDKFAELIVRECIEQVMTYQLHNNRTGEMVPFIVEDIKLHFGVK